MKVRLSWILLLVCSMSLGSYAQENYSLSNPGNDSSQASLKPDINLHENHMTFGSVIIPATFITYGFVSLKSGELKEMDQQIKEEIWTESPHHQITIDNYLQYAPAMAVYGLNAVGIHGKNNFRDRTMIYLLSNLMMGVTVQSIKAITRIPRPDGGGTNAFPSGHTATAFVGAEFLRQEYRDRSPWYGVAGYAVGATTAYLRMYNNVHWFRDLLPGAGIGILSTRVAYWVYPAIKKKLFTPKISPNGFQ